MASINQAFEVVKAAITINLQMAKDEAAREEKQVIPLLIGDPGLGKTAIVRQVAEDLGLELEVVRLAEYEPSDMAGWNLPNEAKDKMTRIKPNWIPDGDKPTLVFFDEITQGHTMNQNVVAQAVNERRVGPHALPDNAVIVCAGNPQSAKAGTTRMPTHLKDRLTHVPISANVDDVVSYFMANGIDTRLCGYLKFRPDMLSQFDRDADACPSPRSWERVDTWLKAGLPNHLTQIAIEGQVGRPAAVDFSAYLTLTTKVPDIDELIANPTNEAKAPTKFEKNEMGIMYAIAAALVPRINSKTAENIIKYVRRLPRQELGGFIVAEAYRMNNEAGKIPAIRDWMLTEGREYLLTK